MFKEVISCLQLHKKAPSQVQFVRIYIHVRDVIYSLFYFMKDVIFSYIQYIVIQNNKLNAILRTLLD